MEMKKCDYCAESFEGRANQKYCSIRCKSAVNNSRINERDKNLKVIEKKIKTNRRILMMLEQVFGSQELPSMIIKNSKLTQDFNTGVLPKERVIQFYDYNLQVLENTNFKIFKV